MTIALRLLSFAKSMSVHSIPLSMSMPMSMPLMKILNSNGPTTDPLRDSPQRTEDETLPAQLSQKHHLHHLRQSQRLLTVNKYVCFTNKDFCLFICLFLKALHSAQFSLGTSVKSIS